MSIAFRLKCDQRLLKHGQEGRSEHVIPVRSLSDLKNMFISLEEAWKVRQA